MTTPWNDHLPSIGWSPTIQRMVTQQEGSILQTRNLALRLNSQNYDQVTTAMNGHLPSPGWSPTIQNMITNLPKYGHHPKVGNPPSQGRPPTITSVVTHCPKFIVTHHPQDDHPPIPSMVITFASTVTHHIQEGQLDLDFDSSAVQLAQIQFLR